MAKGSWNLEIESPVSAARLFKAVTLDWHNLGPKIKPEIIVSATAIQGDGAVGSLREFKFTSAIPFSFAKERLDFVDHEKFECKQSLVEGADIGKTLETASSHFKFEPTTKGGCVCKVAATFKALPGAQITEDEIAKAKKSVTEIVKAAEAYLLANPGAYA